MIPEALDCLALGQLGGQVISDTNARTGGKWGALFALTDVVFTSLVSNNLRGTMPTSLKAGMVLLGQFSAMKLTSGTIVAYDYTTNYPGPPDWKPELSWESFGSYGEVTVEDGQEVPAGIGKFYAYYRPKGGSEFIPTGQEMLPNGMPYIFEVRGIGPFEVRFKLVGDGDVPYLNKETFASPQTISLD